MTSLAGRRIVVTREEPQNGPLSRALREAGAVPLHSPTVEVTPLHGPEERRSLLPSLEGFDWLIVTSPRTVTLLAEAGALETPRPPGLRTAVAGERTAEALAQAGWSADCVPDDAGAEPLLALLLDRRGSDGAGGRVFFPASARAGRALPDGLTAAGFHVRRLDLYAPAPRIQDPAWWWRRIEGGIDGLSFTSPSAVHGLLHGLADPDLKDSLRTLPVGVQGPTTAAVAREAGWADVVEARPRSFHGLVDALVGRFDVAPASTPSSDLQRA